MITQKRNRPILNKQSIDSIYQKPNYIVAVEATNGLATNKSFTPPPKSTTKKVCRIIKAHKGVMRKKLILQAGMSKALVDRCVRALIIDNKVEKKKIKGEAGTQTMLIMKGEG